MREKDVSCNRMDCFACTGRECRILSETKWTSWHPCPFYKTPIEAYESRVKAEERLKTVYGITPDEYLKKRAREAQTQADLS